MDMKVVIACGSGVATSTVIAERVQRVVKEAGFNAQIVQCGVNGVEAEAKDATLV
ncbi:MAG: PTS galactitol transporter subunit IIB, partial [Oscillospiraceae bacterium]|nr:PTS galactitol transporter subunit IIB [Oscillospiraceae bacterium]